MWRTYKAVAAGGRRVHATNYGRVLLFKLIAVVPCSRPRPDPAAL